MRKIEGINLKELVDECRVSLKKEKDEREKLGQIWANYWAEKAMEAYRRKYQWLRP